MDNRLNRFFSFLLPVISLLICLRLGGLVYPAASEAYEKEVIDDIEQVIDIGIAWYGGDAMLSFILLEGIEGPDGEDSPRVGWSTTKIFLRGVYHDDTPELRVWCIEDYLIGDIKGAQASELRHNLGVLLSKETSQTVNSKLNPEQGSRFILIQKKDDIFELGHFLENEPSLPDPSDEDQISFTAIERVYRSFTRIINLNPMDTGTLPDSPLIGLYILDRVMSVAAQEPAIFDSYFFKFRKEDLIQSLRDALKTDEKGRVAICHRKGDDEGRTLWVDLPDAFDHLEHGDDPGRCSGGNRNKATGKRKESRRNGAEDDNEEDETEK